MSDEPQTALLKFVETDIATEWQRKSSLESRSLAVITANLALITLFFAIRTQLRLTPIIRTSALGVCVVISLAIAVLSIAAALWVVAPRSYSATDPVVLGELKDYISRKPNYSVDKVVSNLLEARLQDLDAANSANGSRAFWLGIAYLGLGLSTVFLIVSLLLSNYSKTPRASEPGVSLGTTTLFFVCDSR